MKHVLERLSERLEREPSEVAAILVEPKGQGRFEEREVSIERLAGLAAAGASELRSAGVEPGDRVLVSLPTSEGFLGALFGAMWLGAVPVPLPSLGGFMRSQAYLARFRGVAENAAPAAIVADDATRTALERAGAVEVAVLPPPREPIDPRRDKPFDPPGHHPAFIQYTSGSTGSPKGVVITHDNLAANVRATTRAARFDRQDRFLSWLPVYHDLGLIGGILVPVSQGAVAHLMSPASFVLDPKSWLSAASRYRATVIMAPNFAYSLVSRKLTDEDLAGVDLSSVRLAFNGAEPVDVATAERFAERLAHHGFSRRAYYPVYGLAEATLAVTFPPVDRGIRVDHVRRSDIAAGRRLEPVAAGPGVLSSVSVGCPFEEHELTVVDPESGAILGERQLGEIRVRGASISPRYFARDAQEPAREQLHTGDLGYVADGELYLVDRLKDLVIVAGACHASSDVERVAERVAGVRAGRAIAFGVEEHGTESLVVVAEARASLRRTPELIEAEVRRAIVDEVGLSPSEVVLVRPRSLPLTSSGKRMRSEARALYSRGGFAAERLRGALDPRSLWLEARSLFARLQARAALAWRGTS